MAKPESHRLACGKLWKAACQLGGPGPLSGKPRENLVQVEAQPADSQRETADTSVEPHTP